MSQPIKLNFKVYQGSTFSEILRWESSKKVYKQISNITNAAPCIITSTGHEVPNGWRVKVTNVVGMSDINSTDTYHVVIAKDTDTLELNSINSIGYKPYTSGGIIEYNEPVDLEGYTAKLQIREKIDSTSVIKELTTENGGIIVDSISKFINIEISATDTAAFSFMSAVYSLELTSPNGKVTQLANGSLTLVKEVTR